MIFDLQRDIVHEVAGKRITENRLSDLLKVYFEKEGERFYSEPQQMRCMTDEIALYSHYKSSPFMRWSMGEFPFVQYYESMKTPMHGEKYFIEITKDSIGRIIEEEVTPERSLMCHRFSFLAAGSNVDLGLYWTVAEETSGNLLKMDYWRSKGVKLFYKIAFVTGLAWNELSVEEGKGKVFFEADSDYDKVELSDGETLIVDPDFVIAFEKGLKMEIRDPNKYHAKYRIRKRRKGGGIDFGNLLMNTPALLEAHGPGAIYLDMVSDSPFEKQWIISRMFSFFRERA